jgi:hypothetical protein
MVGMDCDQEMGGYSVKGKVKVLAEDPQIRHRDPKEHQIGQELDTDNGNTQDG